MVEEVVEVEEGELGLDVRVLGEVAAGVTLLGAEGLLDTEDVAERRQAGLEVELRALREVRLLAIIVEREKGRAALDLGLDHAGRGDLEEAKVGVGLAEGLEESGADFKDGRGVLATDDEVTGVGELRRVGVLREARSDLSYAAQRMHAHLVDLVEESVVTAGSLADNGEPVGRQLMVVGRRLALRELVDDAGDLDSRLEREGESIVGLRLWRRSISVSCAREERSKRTRRPDNTHWR